MTVEARFGTYDSLKLEVDLEWRIALEVKGTGVYRDSRRILQREQVPVFIA